MVKLSELRSAEQIAADELRDPQVRQEYERTAFANAVAVRVIGYRAAPAGGRWLGTCRTRARLAT